MTIAYSGDGTRYYMMLVVLQTYNLVFKHHWSIFFTWCTYRLFSCGRNKGEESYIFEWNDSEGTVKRSYHGLGKRTVGVVQFDTAKSRFLAAGDESQIKFWHMNNVNLLCSTDAEGGLPVITIHICLFGIASYLNWLLLNYCYLYLLLSF